MRRLSSWLWLSLAACGAFAAGCGQGRPSPSYGLPHQSSPWAPVASSSQRMGMEQLGPVPNSGLLLPAVSPDGKWIACLTGPLVPPQADAPLTGKGLAEATLSVQPTRKDAQPRMVCPGGAAWMAWSPDSKLLAFVSYSPQGRCELGLHDVAAGQTRRIAVGLKRIAMPAVSPSATKVALIDCDELPLAARLYVLDLQTADLKPLGGQQQGHRRLWPQWIDERHVAYVDWQEDKTVLQVQAVEDDQPQPVRELAVMGSAEQAMLLFAGISRPVSPDGRQIACYDPAGDRIVLIGLAGGRQQAMEPATRSGCWLGGEFLAATDKDLLLSPQGQEKPRRLLGGTWLPLWADAASRQTILCTRSDDDRFFQLVRLRLLGP